MRRITLYALPILALTCGAMAAELPRADLPAPRTDGTNITCYVAPDGKDSNPGTIEQPLATLVCARNALRLAGGKRERRIIIRGGDFYNVALVLEAQDSGLTIQAAAGEKPVLHGGVRVTRWAKDGDRFYSADLPGVKEHRLDFRSLVVDGELRPRARLPLTGKFTHLTRFDAHWESSVGGGFRGADLPETKLHLKYQQGDLGAWLDPNNAELTIYHMWDESMVGVKAHDPETQTLNFSNPSGFPPGAFGVNTFVIWNLREGMQQPGNWYLDRSRGKVVYWPRAGEDIDQVEVVAPSLESVIELNGTELEPVVGITISGLKLTATNTPLISGGWAAGAFKGGRAETDWNAR